MKWEKDTSWNVISNLKDLRDLAQKTVLIAKDLQLTFQVHEFSQKTGRLGLPTRRAASVTLGA
jgi:hypothetical protein